MKPQKCPLVFLLMGALLLGLSGHAGGMGQVKISTNHRGGQASAHMNPKGSTNSNAQWSADPTRGWIRADERHELRKANPPANNMPDKAKNVPDKGKAKTNEKTKGY